MKKVTSEILDQAVELRSKGRNHKEIMAETGLSHSQMERHFVAVDIEQYGGFLPQPESETARLALIAGLREAQQSWGVISVRLREPESRTRKTMKEAGLNAGKGMRIGKGGRYLADEQAFYTGADRAKLGTEIVVGTPIHAQIPTDFDAVPVRTLPKLAKPSPKPRKRTAKKA